MIGAPWDSNVARGSGKSTITCISGFKTPTITWMIRQIQTIESSTTSPA